MISSHQVPSMLALCCKEIHGSSVDCWLTSPPNTGSIGNPQKGSFKSWLANWSSHNILWTWGVISFIATTLIESALDHNSFRCHQCHTARSRPFATVALGTGPFTSSMCSSCTVELHLVAPTDHWKIRASWPFQKAVGGNPPKATISPKNTPTAKTWWVVFCGQDLSGWDMSTIHAILTTGGDWEIM